MKNDACLELDHKFCHGTPESHDVAHCDVETEEQSKQFEELENSITSPSKTTFTICLENLSNHTLVGT